MIPWIVPCPAHFTNKVIDSVSSETETSVETRISSRILSMPMHDVTGRGEAARGDVGRLAEVDEVARDRAADGPTVRVIPGPARIARVYPE